MAISDEVRETAQRGAADAPATDGAEATEGAAGAGPRSETGDADELKDDAARHGGPRGWLEGVKSTRTGALTLKIVVGAIGAILVVAGLIMVPFPGPGWLVVFAGLAVLATEFHWARKVLDFGKRTLASWTDWLKGQGWTVRILVLVVTFAVAGAIIWFGLKVSLGIDVVEVARQFFTR